MAEKSRVESLEGDWDDYNTVYVASVGVTDADIAHAAMVLDRTRSAHLWRWPIPETGPGLRALADAGVPMGVVSNAAGQIEAELRRTGICQTAPAPGVEVQRRGRQ